MKNLIDAITKENRKRLEDFIFEINHVADEKNIRDSWQYKNLIPKGKDISKISFEDLKAYIIGRKEKAINKQIEREVKKIKRVFAAGELISVKISVEWKKSRTWGANPHGEAWATFKDKEGNTASNYVQSGSISGCGYDKLSTAVAVCLNQFNEVLRPLYHVKDEQLKNDTFKNIKKTNREILGYGSGYGILPKIECGVGVSCYPEIFAKVGYNFRSVASGKTFDVFEITKL